MKLHIRKPKGAYDTQRRTFCGKVIAGEIAEYAADVAEAEHSDCTTCKRAFESWSNQ